MANGLIIKVPIQDCTAGIFERNGEASPANTAQLKEITRCHVGSCNGDAWRAVEGRRERNGFSPGATADVALLLCPALQADRHRVQNKMTRIQRTGDIRWAMMNDEFEYADLRQKFAVDAVRNFEESK